MSSISTPHPENAYLNLLRRVLTEGEARPDRTGTGTWSLFGPPRLEFDVSQHFPLLTTKKVSFANILKELLWFIGGQTDSKLLEAQKVRIWKPNTSQEFLQQRGLDYPEGDAGPIYGFQWRHWNAEYKGTDHDYTGQGIDQLAQLVQNIKENPYGRRHILSAWNVGQLDQMALPPCHIFCQFYVSTDGHLDCQLYQRSADLFLGVPYNIASYTLLLYMVARLTGLKPRKFLHCMGDVHIYQNHKEQVELQLSREPKPWPQIRLEYDPESVLNSEADFQKWSDFHFKDFQLLNYDCHPFIRAPMAV